MHVLWCIVYVFIRHIQKITDKLSNQLIICQYIQSIQEAIAWIEDKQVTLLNREIDSTNLMTVENEYRHYIGNQHIMLAISQRVEELEKNGENIEKDKQIFTTEMKKYTGMLSYTSGISLIGPG